MAAPSVTARNSSQGSGTSHTIALPATRNVGERILVSFVSLGGAAGPGLSVPEGWNVIGSGGLGGGSGVWHAVIEHVIDGEEDDTIVFTSSTSTVSCHRTWAGPFQDAVIAGPETANANTASYPEVEVEEGDYLVFAICGTQTGAQAMTISTPADYGEAFTHNTGNNGAAQGTFERSLLGITSEQPGDSTLGSSERSACFTVAYAAAEPPAGAEVEPVGIAQAQALEPASITQTHVLTPDGIAHAQALEAPAITQTHALTPAGIAHGQALEAPSITVQHEVTPGDTAQAQALEPPGLQQEHQLTPVDIAQAQQLALAAIVQTHQLAVQDIAQEQGLEAVTLIITGTLAPGDITQLQDVEGVAIVQDHQLVVADLSQLQVLGSPEVQESHSIVPAGIAQAQDLEEVTIVVTGIVQPATIAQAQELAGIELTQEHLVSVGDIAQLQVIGPVVVVPGLVSDLGPVADTVRLTTASGTVRVRDVDGSIVRVGPRPPIKIH